MAHRYNSRSQTRFGVAGLPSGYDSIASSELTIPSVGLEDVDRALFSLFDKEIPFQVSTETETKRVPIIFATGERWAQFKNGRALRDKNNSLMLPLITIGRTNVQQVVSSDIAGRGINQQTGEIIVKRRLDSSDRAYQSLINRMLIPHQKSLASAVVSADQDVQLSTERTLGDMADDPTVNDGGLLLADKTNNVYETIVLPSPQFYSVTYDVIIWTQYQTHMNQVLEQMMSSFLPQGNAWKLETQKGYWFIATVDNNTFSAENNFDDFAQKERLVRYKFSVNVPAYVLASNVPGAPVPIKRYVSTPSVSFIIDSTAESEEAGVTDPFLGSDDPTLPLSDEASRRRDQRRVNGTRLYNSGEHDPALSNTRQRSAAKYKKIVGIDRKGRQIVKFVRIASVNPRTGETVYSTDPTLGGLNVAIDEG